MDESASSGFEYRFVLIQTLQNGPLRTAGRFCFCTVLTTLFLVVSITLSLVLVSYNSTRDDHDIDNLSATQWIRPPNVDIGNVQPSGGVSILFLPVKFVSLYAGSEVV